MKQKVPTTKICSKCGVLKGLGEFHKNRKAYDGHTPDCKNCVRERAMAFYVRHRGDVLERTRKYKHEHTIQIAEHKKEYYATHREYLLWRHKEYQKTHKDEYRKRSINFHKAHKEKVAEYKKKYASSEKGKAAQKRKHHAHDTRMKATENTLTDAQWKKILVMQNNRCNICHSRFTAKLSPTTDHIIPLSKGGGLTFENVQALCGSCNSSKHAKLDPQFIQTWL